MTGWDVVEPVLTLGLSVSSLVVASIALSESARNGESQRKHSKLSVTPLLHTWMEDDATTRKIVLYLQNNGIGPAIIKRILFFPDGATQGHAHPIGELAFLLDKQIPRFFDRCSYRAISLAPAYALSAGAQLTLITFDSNPELPGDEAERLAVEIRNSLSCFIEYENIYGESFRSVDP